MTTPDLFVQQHSGIVDIHRQLQAALSGVTAAAAGPLEALVAQARGAGGFLLAHHRVEDTILFPGLRRAGRLRSADVAFLDARDREHQALHALVERLLAEASSPHPRAPSLAGAATEALALFVPHIEQEEAGLAPDRLRAMITLAGLEEVVRQLDEVRRAYVAAGGPPGPPPARQSPGGA